MRNLVACCVVWACICHCLHTACGGEVMSNHVSIGGSTYRVVHSGESLRLESSTGEDNQLSEVRIENGIAPSSQVEQIVIAPWGRSVNPLLAAVVLSKRKEECVYHAIFFRGKGKTGIDPAHCFAMKIDESPKPLRILAVSASHRSDSILVVLGNQTTVDGLRSVDESVIWICDCPNDGDVAGSLSRMAVK